MDCRGPGTRIAYRFFRQGLTKPFECFECSLLPSTQPKQVAAELGNGFQVTAQDTVQFCLWVAAHNPRNFVKALSQAIGVGGDCDTNAAIVGGIVALSAGRKAIPRRVVKVQGIGQSQAVTV